MICGIGRPWWEIIEYFGGPRYLFTVSLKNFHLFKIIDSIINFYLNFFLNNNFKYVKVF